VSVGDLIRYVLRWGYLDLGFDSWALRLESDGFIPADMLLISSSEPEGLSYIETSNLDG
jgi:hypothetical protein